METANKEVIEILNDLILINNDRIIGYERAIKETKPEDADLKTLFASMIGESHKTKLALANEVQVLHGELAKGTTNSGKIYRAWMEVKAAFTGHNRHEILASCEFGEDATQKAYRTALEHKGLPTYLRQTIQQQQRTLRASHDEIKALRDQYA